MAGTLFLNYGTFNIKIEILVSKNTINKCLKWRQHKKADVCLG